MDENPQSFCNESGAVVADIDSKGVLRVPRVMEENSAGKLLLDVDPKAGLVAVYACAHSGMWIRWLFRISTDTNSLNLLVFSSAHSMRRLSNRLWEFEVVNELIGGGSTGAVWIESSDAGKSIDYPLETVTESFIGDTHGDEYPEPVALGVSLDPVIVADGKSISLSDGGSRVECRSVRIMQRSKLLRDRNPKQNQATSSPWCSQLKVWSFADQCMRVAISATVISQFTGKVYLPLICTSTGFTAGIRRPFGSVLSIPVDVGGGSIHRDVDSVDGIIMWGGLGMVEILADKCQSSGIQTVDKHTLKTEGGYHKNYWLCGFGSENIGGVIYNRFNPGDTVSREVTVKFTV